MLEYWIWIFRKSGLKASSRSIVRARSLLCYWAVRELGVRMVSLAERHRISPAAVTQSVARGERLAKEGNYRLK